MPGEDISPIESPTTSVPTPPSLRTPFLSVLLAIGVAGALYVTGLSVFSSTIFLMVLISVVVLLAGMAARRPPQEEASPPFAAQQSHITTSQTPPVQSLTSAIPLGSQTADGHSVNVPAAQQIDFNLRTAVEETVARFTNTAKEKGVDLSCLFSSDSPVPFRGDPSNLRIILMNVLDYALTHTAPHEITVRCVLREQTATHATFRFSVSSLSSATSTLVTSAIAATESQTQKFISLPFGEESGIATSTWLVKALGGQLNMERSPNVGTTIWFTLPLEKQPPKIFPALSPRTNLSGIRVLVVSDDFALSEEDIVTWGLTSHHFPRSSDVWPLLTAATDIGEAYQVVVLHCQRLDTQALDFAAHMRQTDTLAATRLVFITNSGRKGDARQVRQAGYDAYLTSPVSSALLFECLTTVLGQPSYPLAPHLPLVTRYTLAETRMRGRARILIVDSSLPEQKYAARLVEALGYRSDIATTAREAIEANTRLPYAAVLLPTQMPGIDGIAAAIQIRQHDHQEGTYTPLIGVLQSRDEDEREQCLAAGMDTVIDKPLLSERLKAAINHAYSSATKQRESVTVASRKEDQGLEVNLHDALAGIEGDKELFDEMTLLFLSEYPKSLAKMHEAVTRQDAHALAYSASALKSALGNFAATKALDTTYRLELMGRHGEISLAPLALVDLEKQLSRLRALLTDFRLHAAA